ncbi:MAG: hypothetical protein NC087_08265 [Anaeroplasma bactoclasticum]|nr:hypothetical protein [Anaeroplasma bactoclasticum]MCM1557511.1 hypothetical protein [Anaeroplasma bactoclasticum]
MKKSNLKRSLKTKRFDLKGDSYEEEIKAIIRKDESNEDLRALVEGLKALNMEEEPFFKISFSNNEKDVKDSPLIIVAS